MRTAERIRTRMTKANQENSFAKVQRPGSSQTAPSLIDHVLFLQSTIGNQAVRRLFKAGILQPKLTIGTPGDKYEQEADRLAEQVMKMAKPLAQKLPADEEQQEKIWSRPIAEQIAPIVQQQVEEEKEEEEELQMKASPVQTPEVGPDIEVRINALKGGGQPLPPSTRAFFEPRFGCDFSKVRVHNDVRAIETARTLNARAFAMGRHVVFGAGQYEPQTPVGKSLIAHELTHVAQQNRTNISVHSSHLKIMRDQQRPYPTIGPMFPKQQERFERQQRTFEVQILKVIAIGPVLKIDLRIRHPLNEWQDYHFFGAGPAAGIELPLINREGEKETHTTMHAMRTTQFKGRGRVLILGIPYTNVRYLWLIFTEGPKKAGFADVSWRLGTGIRQPFALGWYFGYFDYGHGLRA